MALRASLYADANAPRNAWKLPTLAFRVQDSPEDLKGARLTLYECDYGSDTPKDDDEPSKKDVLARFSVDAKLPAGKEGLALTVKPLEGYVEHELVAIKKAKDLLSRGKRCLFAVHFGTVTEGKKKTTTDVFFPVFVPHSMGIDDVDEGDALEIGMELEVDGKVVASQLKAKQTSVATVPIQSPVLRMLKLSMTARGAAATDDRVKTGAMVQAENEQKAGSAAKAAQTKGGKAGAKVLGRFNDHLRKPSVEPELAPAFLGSEIVKRTSAGEKDTDVDGLLFSYFVPKAERRKVIETILAPRIRHAWDLPKQKKGQAPPPSREGEAPGPDDRTGKNVPKKPDGSDNYGGFGLGDIARAYFVVHDIGAGLGPFPERRWTNEGIHKKDPKDADSVHGYLNRRGTYATYRDFGKDGYHTVNQFTAGDDWLDEWCIGIECTPFGSRSSAATVDPDDPTLTFACMGWTDTGKDRTGIYKFSAELIEALADLYVLASARAGHLLTVTAHSEVDRALVYSMLYPGKREEVRKRIEKQMNWWKYARAPYNMHGDPYGFDAQVLYDKITEKLNALAKGRTNLVLPMGVRYGIHPNRLLTTMPKGKEGLVWVEEETKKKKKWRQKKVTLSDHFPGLKITHGNDSDDLHTFPHQSNPKVLEHEGMQPWSRWNEYSDWSKGKWFWQEGWTEPTKAQLEEMKEAKKKKKKKKADDAAGDGEKKE